ncbi:butyrate--CoA ligase AAE11, peroxisomal-like [Fagus crenata]
MDKLEKCGANYSPLSPITFLNRASACYANRTSVIYQGIHFTWRETYERCCRLASSLRSLNIVKNDVVSVLAPNIPAMYEMHFAVPMAGAVLNTINTRLDSKNVANILRHSEAKVFFVDCQFVPLAREALRLLMGYSNNKDSDESSLIPLVIVIDDIDSPTGTRLGQLEYEELVQKGNPSCEYLPSEAELDEWDPIALNYTSGTTSEPKEPKQRPDIKSPVQILTGGAPPPASLLEQIEPLGFHVTHAYGLTEATGPALVCEWQAQWNQLPRDEQAKLKARQGISILTLADVDVKDVKTMASVPHDGKAMGEIVLRGSSIMKGYFKDQNATSKAFKDGWFFTGDVGVVHPDGYMEIKDRSKDVIISGGENISSVELESVLYKHPRVLEAAVVAMPHPRWGESPCAFIAIKKNSAGKTQKLSEAEIISYCRKNLSHFMIPKKVEFLPELPKNSTGKILKNELRAKAKELVVLSENLPNDKSSQVNKPAPQYNSDHQILAISRL